MSITYNIYCDESCHLEHDQHKVMVLGAVWCPLDKVHEITMRLREIKLSHHLTPNFEVKWTKVSPKKAQFYLDLMDYFFDDDDLHFRALVVPDKSTLHHDLYHQDHDTWYFKMYFSLLKVVLNPDDRYRIYLDIKDTRSAVKVAKLHDVLCNATWDFDRRLLERVQTVRSHEVALLQLTDLLVGAISYANRNLSDNAGKAALVRRMQQRSGYALTRSTLLREDKVNVFIWHASESHIEA